MNDLSNLTSRSVVITLASGRKVRSAPLTIDDHGELQEWLDRQQPDAFEAAHVQIARGRLVANGNGKLHREPYPVEIQRFLLERALALNSSRRLLIGSPEAAAVLNSYEGMKEQVRIVLRKATPDLTDEDVETVIREMGQAEKGKILDVADVIGPHDSASQPDPKLRGDGETTTARDLSRSTGGASSVL